MTPMGIIRNTAERFSVARENLSILAEALFGDPGAATERIEARDQAEALRVQIAARADNPSEATTQ